MPYACAAHPTAHPTRRPPPHAQVICVDPSKPPGDNTTRLEVATKECLQAVIFDHFAK